MKGVLTLVTVVVVLAIIRTALVALMVVLAIMLLWSFITRPRETLVFVVTLTLSGLASAQPIAFIVGVVIIAVATAVVGRKRHGLQRKLLDHSY